MMLRISQRLVFGHLSALTVIASVAVCGLARAEAPASQYFVTEERSPVATDRKTGLIWERMPSTAVVSFLEAQNYCMSLRVNGLGEWRLPSMRELMTLVDPRARNPAIDKKAFPSTAFSEPFWTSTVYQNKDPQLCANGTCAWLIDFGTGAPEPGNLASKKGRARCVRSK